MREYTYAQNTLQRIIYNCLQTRLFYLFIHTLQNGARLSINTSVQIYTCVEEPFGKRNEKKEKKKNK